MNRTKEAMPIEPRPLSQAEWDQLQCELMAQEMEKDFGPIMEQEEIG